MGDPILFIDSGIGGLPYLQLAKRRLPEEHFIYLADRANFPYGTRRADEVREAVISAAVRADHRFRPKVIVLACNTATMIAIDALRERLAVPFVGVVPAVKPAASLSKNGRIGLLASGRAVKEGYLRNLIDDHAAGCRVLILSADEMIRFAETRFVYAAAEEKRSAVRRAIAPLRGEGVDTVVLACTHFLVMEKEFREVLDREIGVVDSRVGVMKQLIRILDDYGMRDTEPEDTSRDGLFYLKGDGEPEERYAIIARRFGLTLAASM